MELKTHPSMAKLTVPRSWLDGAVKDYLAHLERLYSKPVPSPSPEAPAPMRLETSDMPAIVYVQADGSSVAIRHDFVNRAPSIKVAESSMHQPRPLSELIGDAALSDVRRRERDEARNEVLSLKSAAHTARSVQLAATQEIERLNGKAAHLEADIRGLAAELRTITDVADSLAKMLEARKAEVAKLGAENAQLRRQLETPPTPAPPATPCLTAEEATALETLNRALDQAEALGLDSTSAAFYRNQPATQGIEEARHALLAKFRDRVLARPVKPHRTK